MLALAVAGLLIGGCTLIDLDGLQASGAGGSTTTTSGAPSTATGTTSSTSASSTGSGASIYATVVEEDHPLSYYRFDDTGEVAKDEEGNRAGSYAGGVTHGSPGAIAGDSSTSLTLDGQSGAVVLGDAFDFAPNLPFSIEVWARADAVPDYSAMFEKTHRNPRNGYTILFYPDGHAGIERWTGDKTDTAAGAAPLELGVWHHTVSTFSADGMLRFYVDGTRLAEVAATADMADSSEPAVIGAGSTLGTFFFTGGLDELAIYDHELDQARVSAHYQAGSGH